MAPGMSATAQPIAPLAMDTLFSYKIAVQAQRIALKPDPTPAFLFPTQPGPKAIRLGTTQTGQALLSQMAQAVARAIAQAVAQAVAQAPVT